ncbi:Endonuclease/exonuclease/phosphatase [Suillus subalutaceus]|uniref:Endonuclease/exonuclease/phosphatase n=1 Tax=Suillus subalutaceus TaxID=48586 RepID=UPI001B86781A|nr:Endonuclease/exonuclease/phosphatase [Suillus subalutaceus]KAG1840059.1 Endonuclease/exonuclease/phosphatase [Suillus subalutaceus]
MPANQQTIYTNRKKCTHANITLASLNVKGRASPTLGTNMTSKWPIINKTVRDNKIGILCIQETHLSDEHEKQIESLFSRRLLVLNSREPNHPGSSAGIAFIINKEKVNINNAKMTVIIPGRAIALTINWHNEKTIRILNIYAPNNHSEHPNFWNTIKTLWPSHGLGLIDFMMGDFNVTEDPLDRAPARFDTEYAIEALREFRTSMNIQDTWRHTHLTTRLFTFTSNTNSMSHLDRIYTSPAHSDSVSDWKTYLCPIPTDHNITLVRFAPPGLPHIGRGRWTWPLSILSDKPLIEKIEKIGIKLQNDIEKMNIPGNRTETENPLYLWEEFKINMNNLVKQTTKSHLAKINNKIKQLQKDIHKTSNAPNIDSSVNRRQNKTILEKEIEHLERKRQKSAHLKAQAQWSLQGETISKYWTKVNNPKKPRDIIHRL